jgi:hypothetical protein
MVMQRYRIMEEQAVMFRSGQISLTLSLVLALLALVVVSGNVVLALLASACMLAVITVFLGILELMGWTLGAFVASTFINSLRNNKMKDWLYWCRYRRDRCSLKQQPSVSRRLANGIIYDT